jgi:uncharacterized membrane protein YgdD (TMEM256/DUF423 family)
MQRSNILVILLAALAGAAGVALSAVAAHGSADSVNLDTASRFLLIHAAALLALAAIGANALPFPRWLAAATFALAAGVALFSGDLACRAFSGARLFPYAAPIGGSLTIGSWLALAAWALAAALRPSGTGRSGEFPTDRA